MKIRNACLVLATLPWALPAFAGERSERLLPPDPAATPGTSNVAEAAAQTDGSFPAEMALDYILGAGYSAVSDLKPVNNFVWRGTAVKDGVTFNVAVDYTGTVVGAN